jgi:hypothetical protein
MQKTGFLEAFSSITEFLRSKVSYALNVRTKGAYDFTKIPVVWPMIWRESNAISSVVCREETGLNVFVCWKYTASISINCRAKCQLLRFGVLNPRAGLVPYQVHEPRIIVSVLTVDRRQENKKRVLVH